MGVGGGGWGAIVALQSNKQRLLHTRRPRHAPVKGMARSGDITDEKVKKKAAQRQRRRTCTIQVGWEAPSARASAA